MSEIPQPIENPELDAKITSYVNRGYRLESRYANQAVLVKGKPVNHILHLLLSVFTLGIWLLVWPLIAIFGGETRRVLTVREDGSIKDKKS